MSEVVIGFGIFIVVVWFLFVLGYGLWKANGSKIERGNNG